MKLRSMKSIGFVKGWILSYEPIRQQKSRKANMNESESELTQLCYYPWPTTIPLKVLIYYHAKNEGDLRSSLCFPLNMKFLLAAVRAWNLTDENR